VVVESVAEPHCQQLLTVLQRQHSDPAIQPNEVTILAIVAMYGMYLVATNGGTVKEAEGRRITRQSDIHTH
jgi:hypothetical protein